jgi:hypothetical protein
MIPILERLKQKKPPKVKQTIQINIPKEKESISISTTIQDKRKESDINRENILKRLEVKPISKESIEIQSVVPEKPTKVAKKVKKLILKEKETTEVDKEESTKVNLKIISEGKEEELTIQKLPPIPEITQNKNVLLKASSYFLNNRQSFINFINNLFEPYKEELKNVNKVFSCKDQGKKSKFELLVHQKIVRDYLNLYTPYRGLLLYHGLGSGKTCTSIAIAEGLKSWKPIIIMTPASLRKNYIEELKKCGDEIYKHNQHWIFVKSNDDNTIINNLQQKIGLNKEQIKKKGGAWLSDQSKNPNYKELSQEDKISVDFQINEMIRSKYRFINYNGLRMSHLNTLTRGGSVNPFENTVVIIDEAHNFISRIVNKLKKTDSLSMQLYQYLLKASNCRIVLLSGTPIINYPNELGITFNILRGFIKTWKIPVQIKSDKKVDENFIKNLFQKNEILKNIVDYSDYKPSSKILTLTRNPFGFISSYNKTRFKGVYLDENGDISDEDFLKTLEEQLQSNKIEIDKSNIKIENYKALPDTLDEFQNLFIKDNKIKNSNLFMKRIIGLTSYYGDATQLMPKYDKTMDLHIIKLDMSDYQFGVYESARIAERKLESQNKRKKKKSDNLFDSDESTSTYRIFSRAFCNFVFPKEIKRPMPKDETDLLIQEDLLDGGDVSSIVENIDGRYTLDDQEEIEKEVRENTDQTYDSRIKTALQELEDKSSEFLSKKGLETYGPKLLKMLENIKSDDLKGLHLVYSQFRTLEGIGIFSLVLKQNGFVEFRVRKNENGIWEINLQEEDLGKPTFALYTGTESSEEKEIIRNIFNSDWNKVPDSISEKLQTLSTNNNWGEIIKVFMITASGAEGISLKNCRYVHIMEPYWHPVRMEQVIGRARRICSHTDLPAEYQTVEVFLYLMKFSEEQLKSEVSIEARLKDKSKRNSKITFTSDQALYEISSLKEEINTELTNYVKQASIDCNIHRKENTMCFSFSNPSSTKFAYTPSIGQEESDKIQKLNKAWKKWKAEEITIESKKYALNKETMEVYDLDSYLRATQIKGTFPELKGKLELENGKYRFIKI